MTASYPYSIQSALLGVCGACTSTAGVGKVHGDALRDSVASLVCMSGCLMPSECMFLAE